MEIFLINPVGGHTLGINEEQVHVQTRPKVKGGGELLWTSEFWYL